MWSLRVGVGAEQVGKGGAHAEHQLSQAHATHAPWAAAVRCSRSRAGLPLSELCVQESHLGPHPARDLRAVTPFEVERVHQGRVKPSAAGVSTHRMSEMY